MEALDGYILMEEAIAKLVTAHNGEPLLIANDWLCMLRALMSANDVDEETNFEIADLAVTLFTKPNRPE